MFLQGLELRQVLWSSLCETDSVAYSQYLRSCELVFSHGWRFVEGGGAHGTGWFEVRDCRCIDNVGRADVARVCDGGDSGAQVVDGVVVAGGIVGAEDNGDGHTGKGQVGLGLGGLSAGSSDSGVGGLSDGGTVSGVSSFGKQWRSKSDAKVDGGSMGSTQEVLTGDEVPEWRRGQCSGLGRHYFKNKAKREKRKLARNADVASVRTVDTRTAVELEAAQTLAARRVAENKVAVALAEHKLRVLNDKDRTVMVDRLAAARAEQRINDAKAKSQASFKKCDQSLKSLGSSGSAGEFALKQEVKKAKDNEALRVYVEAQLKLAMKYASPDVHQMIAAMPPPVLQDEFEAFGECPSEYDEEEQQAYFDDLNRRNEENFDRCATYC